MTPESDRELLIRIDERTLHIHTELLGEDGRVPKLEKTTTEHASQINMWRGAILILAGLVTIFGGVVLAHVLVAAK